VSESVIQGELPAPPAGGAWPIVIVGAGAAGLLAGIFAGRAGRPALLLESRPRPGAKIRVSGGGRCNVLPSEMELDDFHTEGSRNALKNVLASWPLRECRAFFEQELGVRLVVEPTGKVFPASSDAKEVLHALFAELERAGGTIAGGARVEALTLAADAGDGARFELRLAGGRTLRARSVIVATGGLSLPKTGSDGFGYKLAHDLGHNVLRRYPALVPLLTTERRWNELAGVSLVAKLSAMHGDRLLGARTGDFLFTHEGFSGPVVLDQSRYFTGPDSEGVHFTAGWLGLGREAWDERLRAGGSRSVMLLLREHLPRRLAGVLVHFAAVDPERKLSELTREERKRLVHLLGECPLSVSGHAGYAVAEVTGGGLALDEVRAKTLESRRVPGLYFCGEVLDVTGRIGGFNFLWAWVSGRKAGTAAASE
jgi:predicted Rossmann fold flavoprotein